MKKKAKVLVPLSTALVVAATSAYAAIDGYVIKGKDGQEYYYDYTKLKNSLEASLIDASSPGAALWNHFAQNKESIVALHDDVKKSYVDYQNVRSAYEQAVINNDQNFNVNRYTETDAAQPATLPPVIKEVVQDQNGTIGTENKETNPGQTTDLKVESVTAINGTVTVVLNNAPETAPVVGDFTITQSINGAAATTVTPSAIQWNAETKTAVLTVPQVEATDVAQSVVVTAAYKGTEAKTAAAFTVDPQVATGLVVKNVTSIDNAKVEVTFDALTQAIEGATVTVVDPNGVTHAVKPVNLEVGETEATFEFETAISGNLPLGNWTVAGKTFDTGVPATIKAIDDALTDGNQIALWNALKSSYFTGAVEANIAAYEDALGDVTDEERDTIAEIQAIINKVNEDTVTGEQQAAAAKAVNDARNQLQLDAALKSPVFQRYNPAWIADYAADANIHGGDGLAASTNRDQTAAEIQTGIDTVNAGKVDAAIDDALDELDSAKVATARTLVTNYIPADEEDEHAKADMLKNLDIHDAVIAVNKADTNNKLTNALNALAALTEDIDTDKVNSLELTRYRGAIADPTTVGLTDAAKLTAAGIQDIIEAANAEAEQDAVDAVKAVTDETTTAQLKTLLQNLADRSEDFDMETVIDGLLEDYRDAIVAGADGIANAGDIQDIITGVNNPATALGDIDAATDADALLAALKSVTLNLNNVKDANKAQYDADIAAFKTAADAADTTTVAAVQAQVNASNAVVDLNAATTGTAAKTALTAFAIATADNDYINLSSAAKLEVAELVLAAKPDGGFATSADVTTEIAEQIDARDDLIGAVNAADTIAAVDAALEALDYDAYSDLDAAKQLEVAEAFLNAFPKDAEGAKVDYTTIAGIKADIDKAITATN